MASEHGAEVSMHSHTELITLDSSDSNFESNVAFVSIDDFEDELFVFDGLTVINDDCVEVLVMALVDVLVVGLVDVLVIGLVDVLVAGLVAGLVDVFVAGFVLDVFFVLLGTFPLHNPNLLWHPFPQ